MGGEMDLTGARKAAILIMALGNDAAPPILQGLTEEEINRITFELSSLERVPDDIVEAVVRESADRLQSGGRTASGGFDFARDLLLSSLEPERANVVLDRISKTLKQGSFMVLKEADMDRFAEYIRNEHPQTIALILSNMEPEQAGRIISLLPEEQRPDIILRITRMADVSPEITREVTEFFAKQRAGGEAKGGGASEGAKHTANILSYIDQEAGDAILDRVKQIDEQAAETIVSEIFTFEDLATLDDRDVQKIFEEVDIKQLSLALKGAGEELKNKCLENLSERNREMIESEMSFLGSVKKASVEEARRGIVGVFRSLESRGEISRAGAEEEEMVE
jgi:flagellar motor switch protein FliG